MKKKYMVYLAFTFVVLAIVAAIGFAALQTKKNTGFGALPPEVRLCFVKSQPFINGGDTYALLMAIAGDKVTGTLSLEPGEKDKKTGAFTGTMDKANVAGMIDTNIMGTLGTFWWKTSAEGMLNTEELRIKFEDPMAGQARAYIGFGEMKDRGDGTYVYANPDAIDYSLELNEVNCDTSKEADMVSSYIQEHLSDIIQAKPTLGGTWYTTNVYIEPSTKTGTISYEDGHIAGKQPFVYGISGDEVVVDAKIDYTQKTALTYVSFQSWPPKVTTAIAKFTCAPGGTIGSAKGKTIKKDLPGGTYCINTMTEGAAGSTYTTYAYSTMVGDVLAKTTFIARTPQCMNYDEPEQGACKAEQAGFNPDVLADGLIHQLVK